MKIGIIISYNNSNNNEQNNHMIQKFYFCLEGEGMKNGTSSVLYVWIWWMYIACFLHFCLRLLFQLLKFGACSVCCRALPQTRTWTWYTRAHSSTLPNRQSETRSNFQQKPLNIIYTSDRILIQPPIIDK